MLFSSNIFIFIFLPLVMAVYYAIPRRYRKQRNLLLCVSSLFFYAWGEPVFVFVLMLSILGNYFLGMLVEGGRERAKAKMFLLIALVMNLSVIFIFKYLNFVADNLNLIVGDRISVPEIALPIGISFFTFQAISYVVDVYRGNTPAQRNLFDLALYISFFPQLIAGPIIRYNTIAEQIDHRQESWDLFAEGVSRFIVGLGKKVILANSMAVVADQAYELLESGTFLGEEMSLPCSMAWLGAVAYTFQIFFDFSGYSDMAIGMGKMFGFRFLENFNYPYISSSVTEFWRRWHISLGSWFRDYVYIPLGGSRVKTSRHILNLLAVWLLTGIWHGANWTFILWGMMYFVLLVMEKYVMGQRQGVLSHVYTMFFVMMGWVVFRADSLGIAGQYIATMFSVPSSLMPAGITLFYLRQYLPIFMICVLASMPIAGWVREKMGGRECRRTVPLMIKESAYAVVMICIFIVSVSFIVKGSYNPFIYFNF